MTNDEIKQLSQSLSNAINGTKIRVYDTDGDIWTFKLEDVIDIREKPYKNNVVTIVLKNDAGTYMITDNNGNITVKTGTLVYVSGNISKWKQKFNFNIDVIN